LSLPHSGLIWLCPEADIAEANERAGRELTPWLDPTWGWRKSSPTWRDLHVVT
jgi:hypothetical protein